VATRVMSENGLSMTATEIDSVAVVAGVEVGNREEAEEAEQTTREPRPTPEDVEFFTFAPSGVDVMYPNDYTGLPG